MSKTAGIVGGVGFFIVTYLLDGVFGRSILRDVLIGAAIFLVLMIASKRKWGQPKEGPKPPEA